MSKNAVIAVLGVSGVLALGFAPMEVLMPEKAGPVDWVTVRALSLINPFLLVVGSAALGAWAAPKLGLKVPLIESLLERKSISVVIRPLLVPVVLSAVAVAVLIVANGTLQASELSSSQDDTLKRLAAFEMPLVSKMLYGGLSEEVIMRWGLMSGCALLALKLGMPRPWAIGVGVVTAGLIFGAGHVPILLALMPNASSVLVGAVLAGNFVAGVVFGSLLSRYGLEAAMLAHAGAHLLSHVAG
jgi:Type II CAAX prenyl endopeptidase Rce1-like